MGRIKALLPEVNNVFALRPKVKGMQVFRGTRAIAIGEDHSLSQLTFPAIRDYEEGILRQTEQNPTHAFDITPYLEKDLEHLHSRGERVRCEIDGMYCSGWAEIENDLLQPVCTSCRDT